MQSHEIEYTIIGSEMQALEITLDPGETIITEPGSLLSMTVDIEMQSIFGDPNKQNESVMNKFFGAGKRLLTGENLFVTTYTQNGAHTGVVTLASPYPGKIIPFDLSQHQGKIICQKDSFLAAAKGTSVGVEFQKKIGVGLFGGEGFIMQKLEGDGYAFAHAGGHVKEMLLKQGEILKVDTGCIVAFESTVSYNIEYVGSIKNSVFGGEGVFLATLQGPGKIWIQSLPFSRLAGKILSMFPQSNDTSSALGGFGNLVMGE